MIVKRIETGAACSMSLWNASCQSHGMAASLMLSYCLIPEYVFVDCLLFWHSCLQRFT